MHMSDMIVVYKILNKIDKVDINVFIAVIDSNAIQGNYLKLCETFKIKHPGKCIF